MPAIPAFLAVLFLATAIPAAQAQTVSTQMRERANDNRARAVVNCKANRGVDCATAEGLREWIDAERPRPAGQRSAIQMQKLEAERRAQQGGAAGEAALRRSQGTR